MVQTDLASDTERSDVPPLVAAGGDIPAPEDGLGTITTPHIENLEVVVTVVSDGAALNPEQC